MARNWRGLPAELSPAESELVEALRSMKSRSGLTLVELAAKTHYSKSSWQRWLNGDRLVTEPALLRLCDLSGASDTERAALLELRASAERGGAEPERAAVADEVELPDPAAEPISEAAAEVEAEQEPEPAPEANPVSDPEAASGADPASEPEAAPEPDGPSAMERPAAADPVGEEPGAAGPGPVPGPSPRTRRGRLSLPAAVLVGVVAVVGVLAVLLWPKAGAPAPAASTPSLAAPLVTANGACVAAGCVAKDPQASGCGADAITIATSNVRQMTIYVRYSKHCRAAWAKITDATVGYSATITNATGDRQTALVHWGYDAYSPMVDASQNDSRLQVCGEQPDGSKGCGPVIMDPATAPALPNPTPVPSQSPSGTPVPAQSATATAEPQQ
ncbi:helix-turn-helix domain-containing protein [Kitasatospora sp. NPDC050543]|uniref:helix-turn-helix domain-containing protein n=1 Tax=Kitasatospora sp. NPDC050543 TaxID=3364054 RepID=UPI0037A84569